MFKDRDELIAYTRAALARASAAAPQWFGLLPAAGVAIEPYPAYRERNAPGEYNPPAEDGSRPGLYYVSAYEAENKSRSGPEAIAFHETIPGHHLQVSIALERRDIHPIGRYLGERARREAEQRLGPAFDIRAFHDRALDDGSVPLTFLAGKIRGWTGGGS